MGLVRGPWRVLDSEGKRVACTAELSTAATSGLADERFGCAGNVCQKCSVVREDQNGADRDSKKVAGPVTKRKQHLHLDKVASAPLCQSAGGVLLLHIWLRWCS